MSYTVAIIGAGRIGAWLDDPQSPHILTHAHAFRTCEGFELAGFVDPDLTKAKAAASTWGGRAFDNLDSLFGEQRIDVVSVCAPDEDHYKILLDLAEKPVKFVFLEKPAVRTLLEADHIRSRYSLLSIRVLVNYTRRFVPEIRRIREGIKSGNYGNFLTGTGYYGKGLFHNGSHLLDLLRFLVGDIQEVKKTGECVDFYDQDPSISALLTMQGGGVVNLRHIDCAKFDVFELDLLFERKRIRICELGTVIEEYSVGANKIFKGYQTLNKDIEYPTEHRKAMSYAVLNIQRNLSQNEPLVCTLPEALDTVKACTQVLHA